MKKVGIIFALVVVLSYWVSGVKAERVYSGSGFFVSPAIVVTNWHIVKDAKEIYMMLYNDKALYYSPVAAQIVACDETNDLVLLSFKGNSSYFYSNNSAVNKYIQTDIITPLPLADIKKVDVGSRIFALGYAAPQSMGRSVQVTDGLISSVNGRNGDPRYYMFSAPVMPGDDGGPLVNEQGQVVGVISGFTKGHVHAKNNREVDYQNVSYALKSSYVIGLMLSLPFGETPSDKQVFDLGRGEDVAALARGAVVRIETER